MFGIKKQYDLSVQPKFRSYGVFMLQKPYESGFSPTSGNAVAERTQSHGGSYILYYHLAKTVASSAVEPGG